jgi:aspartate/methionine/tyrosine aminotransferase
MDGFLKENRRLLCQSYNALCRGFEAIGLRVVPAMAGIFAFCDLRSLLTEQTFEAEHALFEALVTRGVVFTPGHACHCPIPGFFRVVYGYVSLDALLEGIRRVKLYKDEIQTE